MKTHFPLALLLLALPTLALPDVYRWVDGDGRVHYSQTPPADRPHQKVNPRLPQAGAAAPGNDSPAASNDLSQYAAELEKSRLEQDRKKAEAQEEARARTVRCLQAQSRLKVLGEHPPGRIASMNDKGEYERWTTEKYDAERGKTLKVINESCS